MAIQHISKEQQGFGQFNGGAIVENKPIGFPQDGGAGKPYSNLFYWAYAKALQDSTIGLHPHKGFEIMSFVLNGSIRHYDTKLNEWRALQKGDVQIIRAGNGISHAEHMEKDAVMFQIWVDPDLNKTLQQEASYDDYKEEIFPITKEGEISITNYHGEGAPMSMDAEGIQISRMEFERADYTRSIEADRVYSIYVLEGSPKINGQLTSTDDFVIISDEKDLLIESSEAGSLFMISSKRDLDYKTYAQIMQERMARR